MRAIELLGGGPGVRTSFVVGERGMFFAAAALELHSREVELRWLSPMGSMTALLDRRFSS